MKVTQLRRTEETGFYQLIQIAHAIDIFGNPEQRVEITQSTLAFFDIGLDEIA